MNGQDSAVFTLLDSNQLIVLSPTSQSCTHLHTHTLFFFFTFSISPFELDEVAISPSLKKWPLWRLCADGFGRPVVVGVGTCQAWCAACPGIGSRQGSVQACLPFCSQWGCLVWAELPDI